MLCDCTANILSSLPSCCVIVLLMSSVLGYRVSGLHQEGPEIEAAGHRHDEVSTGSQGPPYHALHDAVSTGNHGKRCYDDVIGA
jgi:hypothetical protein